MNRPLTNSAGTVTSEGFIPHKFNHKLGIYMPVMVRAGIPGSGPVAPVKVSGCYYVYALPGGGTYIDPNPNVKAL